MGKYLVGGGGLAKEIIYSFINEEKFDGVWDDNLLVGSFFCGIIVKGKLEDIIGSENDTYYIAIGNAKIREKIYNNLVLKSVKFGNLIHSTATIIDKDSIKIGLGSIVMPFVYLTTNITIYNNCLLHIYSGIHHDATIGAHSVIMPGAKITCGATMGKCTILKSNTAISEHKVYNDYEII